MARRPRLQFPGAVYHVMSRGNRKGPIFEDDNDRHRFFDIVGQAAWRYDTRFYAACLMDNHYHLVLDTPRGNLSDTMQHINGVFTQASNRRHRRTGHLFEARYRSYVIQREGYLLRASRYVVRNPQRAGVTKDAASWPWSTYRATAGLEEAPRWLHLDWLPWAFNVDSLAEAQRKYCAYVNERTERKLRIDPQGLGIGSKAFLEKIAHEAKMRQAERVVPRTCRARTRPPLDLLFVDVEGCPISREEGIHAAHIVHGYYLQEIADYLDVHRSTVSRLLARLR